MRTLQRTTSHYRTPQHSEVAISQYETTCCTAVVSVVTDIHTHASYLQLWVLSLTNTTHARTFAQTHTYTGLIPAVVSVVTDVHPHYTQASYLRLWVLPLTNTHTHTQPLTYTGIISAVVGVVIGTRAVVGGILGEDGH